MGDGEDGEGKRKKRKRGKKGRGEKKRERVERGRKGRGGASLQYFGLQPRVRCAVYECVAGGHTIWQSAITVC